MLDPIVFSKDFLSVFVVIRIVGKLCTVRLSELSLIAATCPVKDNQQYRKCSDIECQEFYDLHYFHTTVAIKKLATPWVRQQIY